MHAASAPTASLVIDHGVEQSDRGRDHQFAVDAVAEGLADIADAAAEAETFEPPVAEAVV